MIVNLETITHSGYALGAMHYYGTLKCLESDLPNVNMQHALTANEATERNKWEIRGGGRGHFYAGYVSSGFNTEDEIIALAKATYKDHFPGATILLFGMVAEASPLPVLDGPAELLEPAKELLDKANALFDDGGWRKHDAELMALYKSWVSLLKNHDHQA